MESLRKKAKELLEKGDIKLVIGYEEAPDKTVRAVFVRKPEDTEKLILDERCEQNLAVYLTKLEIKQLGKPAIIANISALRSILQIASENQIKEDGLITISVTPKGEIKEYNNFKEIEDFIASSDLNLPAKDEEMIKKLEGMTVEERWQFWSEQLSRCIKCYACRASCPMCYCGRCQVEYNQPQLVTVEATPMGNFELHVIRAMHLAGRCVNCGECGRACPVDIPIHLLNFKTVLTVKEKFNVNAGTKADLESVMSNYKPDDKENFIR